ncbi:MAG: cation transporter [Candidatus Bathyarchaeia archaeon]|jgi:hypothetical protein
MSRLLLPALLILVAVVSLGVIVFAPLPEYTNTTRFTSILVTVINPEILLDYTISTISCSGTVCPQQVSPYTYTETWSVQVTNTIALFSTATNYVVYATSGLGEIAIFLFLFIFLIGSGLLVRERITRSDTLLKQGLVVEYTSLAWTIVEAIGAIVAGIFSGSLALLAFSADSIIELVSSFIVVVHIRGEDSAKASTDKSVMIEQVTALLLVMLIPTIVLGTLYAYLTGVEPESSILGILIAVGAVVIMPAVWFEKRRIGKRSNCLPLTIDATESATCFLMSAALLFSLVANFLWKLWWVDYLATLLILLLLAKETVWIWRHYD